MRNELRNEQRNELRNEQRNKLRNEWRNRPNFSSLPTSYRLSASAEGAGRRWRGTRYDSPKLIVVGAVRGTTFQS